MPLEASKGVAASMLLKHDNYINMMFVWLSVSLYVCS